jgi:hypothetical protein
MSDISLFRVPTRSPVPVYNPKLNLLPPQPHDWTVEISPSNTPIANLGKRPNGNSRKHVAMRNQPHFTASTLQMVPRQSLCLFVVLYLSLVWLLVFGLCFVSVCVHRFKIEVSRLGEASMVGSIPEDLLRGQGRILFYMGLFMGRGKRRGRTDGERPNKHNLTYLLGCPGQPEYIRC